MVLSTVNSTIHTKKVRRSLTTSFRTNNEWNSLFFAEQQEEKGQLEHNMDTTKALKRPL